MTVAAVNPSRAEPQGRLVYPLAGLMTVIAVIVALSLVLSTLTQRHVYALLSEEGTHLAASIKASTLHGLTRMHSSQEELIRRLQGQATWLDTTLTGDPRHDGPLIAALGEREDLDIVAVYGPSLQPMIWAGGPAPRHGHGPRWETWPPQERSPPLCPDVCGPLIGAMTQFYASGEAEQAFDTWGWHHGWNGSGPRPVAYARRRERGGVVFVRTSPDLIRRTLDVESFQGLLDNLALTRKVHSIAVTDPQGTVIFSTNRSVIDTQWRDPPQESRLIVVNDPFPLGNTVGALRITLTTDDARQVLTAARRNLTVLTAAASLIGVIGLLSVFAVERRHSRKVDAMREALHHQERLADLGRMAATVAHEIRNPLNALGLTAQRLGNIASLPAREHDIEELSTLVRQEVGRLDRTVEAFLNLARAPSEARMPFDVNDLASSVVTLYEAEAEHRGVTLRCEPAEGPLLSEIDADRMHQAFANLVRNALESSVPGASVRAATRRRGNAAVFQVEDSGLGFSPEALEHATAAFYSTKARGMGLGLTLADRVARDHGGDLTLRNLEDGGAMVELSIPLLRTEET